MPKVMQVSLDLDDFKEDDTDTRAQIRKQTLELAEVFSKAFQVDVRSKLEYVVPEEPAITGGYTIYTFTVGDPDRAEAIREILEWITTANVAMYEG